MLPSNARDVNCRMTRARSAALHDVSQKMPLKALNQQERMMVMRRSAKRATMDENKTETSNQIGVQRKKRAVLQDVTNVSCENSCKNCLNAAKIQVKPKKKTNEIPINPSKVNPSVAIEQCLQPASKMTSVLSSVKEEPESEVTSSTALVKHVLSQSAISSDPPFKDIDSNHKDPQLCSTYAADIYNNFRVAELVRRPSPTFMERVQQDINPRMRGILIDWLVEVCEEYKLVPDTLYLTVYLIDWYLSGNNVERHRLQLLGITCMLIASKYEEICAPRVEELCFVTDNAYTRDEVLKMEIMVLKYFGFQISAPTAKTFLRRFLRAAQASYKRPSYELEYLADYLAELTLVDYSFLNFLPSLIAASAVFLARWTLDQTSHPWNSSLVHHTSYKATDLKSIVFQLQDLQWNTNGCPLNAIRIKYKKHKFKSVAALSSPKLIEMLF